MLRNLILTIIGIMLFSSLAEAQLNYTVRNEFREPHPTNAPNGGLRTNGGILLVNGVQQPSGFSSSTSQPVTFTSVEQDFQATNKTYRRIFNPILNRDGGWVDNDNNTVVSLQPSYGVFFTSGNLNLTIKYRNRYKVNTTAQTEFDGIIANVGNETQIPQYESEMLFAPTSFTSSSGRLYYFMNFADGSPNQSRMVTPVDDQNETAIYKAHRHSNLSTATASSGSQKRLAFDASLNRSVMVYESQGKIYMITRSGNGAWSGEQFIGEGRNPAVDAKNGYLSIVYVRVLPEGFLPQRVGFLKTYQWSSSTSRYETFGDENGYWIRFESNDALINADTQPSVVLGFQNTVADLLIVFDGSAFNGGQYQSGVFYARSGVLFGGAYFLQSARVIPSTLVNDASRSLVRYPSAALLPSGRAAIVWQSYPLGTGNPPIRYAETDAFNVFNEMSLPIDQTYQTVNYQFPTIAVSANGEKHIAWQALNHHFNLSVILYERLTASNGTTPLTQLQLGYSNHYKPSINWASSSTTILAESGTTSFAISKPDGQGFGSFTTFVGRAPNIVASGSKRYCYTTGAGVPYHIQFGEINTSGGGSAQERTLSGGNSGTISPIAMTLGGSPTPTAPSFQLAERVTARLSSEQASAFLELTLADVALNGRSRTGLTFHHLGASLLEDSATLTPQNIFKKLKSRAFVVADSITQISAVVKVRSDALYGLTSNANPQLAVELFNAETHQSLALSQTIFVSNADTAKDFHFTMNLPSSARSVTAELRVKVLGFAPHASHQPSVLNTITLLDSEGGTAMLNQIGGAWESVGSVPTKFALNQNYPNPFNPVTVIRYELPEASAVKLQVFDMLGRVVATVVNERREAGIYEAVFNASRLSSGTYFYRLQAGSATNGASSFVETKKMMLVK